MCEFFKFHVHRVTLRKTWNVVLSQGVHKETCQNRNFYFELTHEVSLFFFGLIGQSKWLM